MRTLALATLVIVSGLAASAAQAQQGTMVRIHANGKPVVLPQCTTMACCKHNRTVGLGKPWNAEAKAFCEGIVARYGR